MVELWGRAVGRLRERLSPENFDVWFGPVECAGVEDSVVLLRIPNRFYADWISSHYLEMLLEWMRADSGDAKLAVRWEVDEALETSPRQSPSRASSRPEPPSLQRSRESAASAGLQPKYTFDSFVVGPSNQLAHAASIGISAPGSRRFNPLFIYGGVGLGKTHLVNAIGHRILEHQASARIVYVSAERFTNDFIWSLQNHRMDEFRDRYRQRCDALLVDDIQFLAGRDQTQEEFFHTFNALYHADKPIVVTSDSYPQAIRAMEERLISRFTWGLVADIQAPEMETRVAIIRKKAHVEGITLADDVAFFLAEHIKSNVRELEGTLIRLAVKASVDRRALDLPFAREALRAVLPVASSVTTVDDIQRATCEYFAIRLGDLKGHRRHKGVALPRQIAMFVCRRRLGVSFPQIGDEFGGKDHSTVISAVRKIGRLVEDDAEVRKHVETLERKLGF
ncbi:MAG: chromosomal replication initiator protein DnaA [Deltaproteobacteria bacterium]|nr:chromosomal replication initiator protein DnaA [Deltaproteobacteria bacterium]